LVDGLSDGLFECVPVPVPVPGQLGAATAAEVLARFLLAEAADEPVRTKEAIAAVAANRVRHFGGLSGPVSDHSRSPQLRDRFAAALVGLGGAGLEPFAAVDAEDPAFASCMRIAHRAVCGALHDHTSGATDYHPLGANPAWAWQRPPAAFIGGFVFYRPQA
jgi:hypothetical protein